MNKILVIDQYLVSGSNKAISINETAEVITLTNTTKKAMDLNSLILKYDSSVSGIEDTDFEIVQTKGNDKILSIGKMKLGIFGTPISLSYFRPVKVLKKIEIPQGEGISLRLVKPGVNIPAAKVFFEAEFLEKELVK